MRPLTQSIFSILAFAFAIWAIWTGYKIWKGDWENPEGLTVSFLIIVALVITAAYLIASSIQRGAEIISQKTEEANKILFYEKVLALLHERVFEEDAKGEQHAFNNLKMLIGLRSPQKILEAVNNLERLKAEGASATELKEALIQLILMIRTEIGQKNYAVKKELELLLKESMRK